MTEAEKLQLLAANTVHTVLQSGAKKPRSQCWTKDSPQHHLAKHKSHRETADAIREGRLPPDGEDHDTLSFTRYAMFLYTSRL